MGASGLGSLLVKEGFLTEQDRATINRTCGQGSWAFAKSILSMGLLDEDELAAFFAERTRYEIAAKTFLHNWDSNIGQFIDRRMFSRLEVLPLEIDAQKITVAVADPLDKSTLKQIEFFCGLEVVPIIAPLSQIYEGLSRLNPEFQPRFTALSSFLRNHAGASWVRQKIAEQPDILETPPRAGAQSLPDAYDDDIEEMDDSDDNIEALDGGALDQEDSNKSDFDDFDMDDGQKAKAPPASSDDLLDGDLEGENPFDEFGDEEAATAPKVKAAPEADGLESWAEENESGGSLGPDDDDEDMFAEPAAKPAGKPKAKLEELEEEDGLDAFEEPTDLFAEPNPANGKAASTANDDDPFGEEDDSKLASEVDQELGELSAEAEMEMPLENQEDIDNEMSHALELEEPSNQSLGTEEDPLDALSDEGDDGLSVDFDAAPEAAAATSSAGEPDAFSFEESEAKEFAATEHDPLSLEDENELNLDAEIGSEADPSELSAESEELELEDSLAHHADDLDAESPGDLSLDAEQGADLSLSDELEAHGDESPPLQIAKAPHATERADEADDLDPVSGHFESDDEHEPESTEQFPMPIDILRASLRQQAAIRDKELAQAKAPTLAATSKSKAISHEGPDLDIQALNAQPDSDDLDPIEISDGTESASHSSAVASEGGRRSKVDLVTLANELTLRQSLCFDRESLFTLITEFAPQLAAEGCWLLFEKKPRCLLYWRESQIQKELLPDAWLAFVKKVIPQLEPGKWMRLQMPAAAAWPGKVQEMAFYRGHKAQPSCVWLADHSLEMEDLLEALATAMLHWEEM